MVAPASSTTSPVGGSRNVRAVLSVRGFRRLLGVRLTSQLGDGWFQAGLAGSVLFNPERQTGALAVAAGFAVLLLPYSLVGPYIGVFLDRWSRRSVLFLTNVVRGALVVPAVLLIWAGHNEQVPFVTLAFLIIGLNRFFLSGISAATPHVVEDARLVTANALSGTLGSVCYSLGLGSSVLLLNSGVPTSFHGYAAVSALAPLGYLSSALLARASFSRTELGPDATERRTDAIGAALVAVARGMIAGLRHLGARRGAAYAMGAQSAFRALYGVLALATLLLYRRYFNTGDDMAGSLAGLGLVFIAGSCGVLMAAVITPMITRRIGGWRWVAGLLTMVGLAVLGFGLPFRALLLVVAVFFINVAAQGIKIVVDTAVQHECADEYRGRVFSVNDTAFNLCFVAGLFTGAFVLPANGRSPGVLAVVSAGYLVVAAWYAVVAARWVARAGDDIAGLPIGTGTGPAGVDPVRP